MVINISDRFVRKARRYLRKSGFYKKVYTRDNRTCYICGRSLEKMSVHHTYPLNQIIEDFLKENGNDKNIDKLAEYPPFRDTSYAITLCIRCHRQLHKDAEENITEEK